MTSFNNESLRCRRAQDEWRQRSIRDRCQFLRTLRHLIVERADALCAAVAADVQRDPGEVIGTDLLSSAANAKWLERYASRVLKPQKARGSPVWLWDTRDTIQRRPHGVVGVIGTWNYPIFLTLGAIMPALVAGNGVLWKPSELAPRTAVALETLLRDAGVPEGLVLALPATREAGPQLCEADIDYLHFTGSDTVGRKIASRLGERLIPSTLELSGVDAFIVMADADVKLAARTAVYGATLNNGQTCMAARRAFVAAPIRDAFLKELQPLLTPMRHLVTEGQRLQHERIMNAATERGLRVLGDSVILDPPADFASCTEATFSPMLSVIAFEGENDLMAKISASAFGLSSAVFTSDRNAATRIAERIPAGSVIVNDVIVPAANPATPFGGRGASGWASTQGPDGLLHMTVPQVVSVRRGKFRPHVDAALNHDPAGTDLMSGLLKLSHAHRWRGRWKGIRQLIRGIGRRKSS